MKFESHNWFQRRLPRLILLVLGMASLVAGVWGGLIRLPLNLPLPSENANWISFHGPLMVCGFLGTVIGLERAVGLGYPWTYASPLLTGLGAAVLLAGSLGRLPTILIAAGSGVFVLISLQIYRMQRSPHTLLMCLGAAAWFTANVLWLSGIPIGRLIPWYIAFLGLVILGERLDLARFQKTVPWAQPVLWAILVIFAAGVITSCFESEAGLRITGIGLLLIAIWLARFDIARRTIREKGLPRFMAISLLSGYVWMAVSGLLFVCFAPQTSGTFYDAALHSFFLGFVFSMIFGHAPIIFPAVLALPPIAFRSRFYLHLAMLHISLLIRLGSDVAGWGEVRQWGGLLNAVTLVVFLGNTAASMISSARKQ